MPRRNRLNPREGRDLPRQRSRYGYPLLFIFTIVVITLIATIMPVNTAGADPLVHAQGQVNADANANVGANANVDTDAQDACDGGMLVRRVVLIDRARNHASTIDAAIAEAESIWATANVRLVWLPIGPRDITNRPDAYVVLHGGHPNPAREAALMKSGGTRELGWVRYDPDGTRANLVEVSVPAVWGTLSEVWFSGRRLRFHPRDFQAYLTGRALGRVIAHEIGHWLIGLGHADEGLMKAVLDSDDLLDPKSPQLPSSWTDASDRRVAALHATCSS